MKRRLSGVAADNNVLNLSDLDQWIADVENAGGVQSQEAQHLVNGFKLKKPKHWINEFPPLSNEYHEFQMGVYQDISGRAYNPSKGEQALVPDNRNQPNPNGVFDPRFISSQIKAIVSSIMLCDLPPNASVIDFGAGWGLSTEMFGYCGFKITAFDINKDFLNLIKMRAKDRGFTVDTVCGDYTNIPKISLFDLAYFHESMHHCTDLRSLLQDLQDIVKPGGTICFSGEPVTSADWPTWGMRLDPLSVYCIRKFGWFESGWSEAYLTSVFKSCGWTLRLIAGIGLGHGYIGIANRFNEYSDDELRRKISLVTNPDWVNVL